MKELIVKLSFSLLIAIVITVAVGIFVSSLSGCARVSYKKYTESVKCNFAIMMAKIKSVKGNESLEVREYIKDCYEDVAVAKCEKKVYGNKITPEREKLLDFLQCVKDTK